MVKQPTCIGGHTDQIIPIVYGMPTEKTMQKAAAGEVYLGGCLVYEDAPKFYCKRHQLELDNTAREGQASG